MHTPLIARHISLVARVRSRAEVLAVSRLPIVQNNNVLSSCNSLLLLVSESVNESSQRLPLKLKSPTMMKFWLRDRPFDFLGGGAGFFSRFYFYFLPIENRRFFFTV